MVINFDCFDKILQNTLILYYFFCDESSPIGQQLPLPSTVRNSNKIYKIVTVIKVIKHQLKIYIFNTQLIKQLTQYYIYYCSKTVNYIVILWLVHAWKKRHFTASTELFYPVPKQCHTHLIRSFCVFLRFYCLPVCPVCPQSSLSV